MLGSSLRVAPRDTRQDNTFMHYKQLGPSGLLVSELCLGTMTFGGRGTFTAIGTLDQSNADRIVARSLEAGINFIDTADVYSEGLSEEITGRAIAHSGRKRTDVVLATKVFLPVGGGPNDRGASRGHIMDGIQASLKRLGTDYIDLYQIHGLDTVTPIEETFRALDDLVRQGSVRYIGVSNWPAWTIMKALGIAALRQVRPRRQRAARLASRRVRLSPRRQGARVRLHRHHARHRASARRLGRAHRPGVGPPPSLRHVGHHRRQIDRAARRQPRGT